MKRYLFTVLACLTLLTVMVIPAQSTEHAPDAKTRCVVCGMFVAKYPMWLASLNYETGERLYFDGVKDMMAFFFSPEEFGTAKEKKISQVEVIDYYKQKWIDGKTAFYVIGSDVLGPMGHELIPFASKPAAENFLKDHHGTEIITFASITHERISAMRMGHMMK